MKRMSLSPISPGGRSCAVTGANGYVGSRIVSHLRDKGWRVLEMRHDRTHRDSDRPDQSPFSLEKGPNPDDLRKIDALIHCAYDFRVTRWNDINRINVGGSARLFTAARAAGVSKIVVLSTISAFVGCKSMYGRAKLAIEDISIDFGAVRVRPGLVYGDHPGGTLGALERAVSISPFVPLVDDGSYLQYLVHEDDLCKLVFELIDGTEIEDPRPVIAAAEQPHSLREILQVLARRRDKKVTFVPVPRHLILALLRIAEGIGLKVGFRSDSLISLVNQDPSPDFGPTRKMGTSFRSFGREP